jgi:hypothetical protein
MLTLKLKEVDGRGTSAVEERQCDWRNETLENNKRGGRVSPLLIREVNI